jgi:hypothetical protein
VFNTTSVIEGRKKLTLQSKALLNIKESPEIITSTTIDTASDSDSTTTSELTNCGKYIKSDKHKNPENKKLHEKM